MQLIRKNNGFTLIEILISITLLTVLILISASYMNYNPMLISSEANQLMSGYADIEGAFNRYVSEKNANPTGLTDATFVPIYLFVPMPPGAFDTTYGTSGYTLTQVTGQTSPNNGWVICNKIGVSGATDLNYLAVKKAASSLSAQKYFYNTSCGATSNMADPGAAATVYTNYWISRS